jgi:hypothetical protein
MFRKILLGSLFALSTLSVFGQVNPANACEGYDKDFITLGSTGDLVELHHIGLRCSWTWGDRYTRTVFQEESKLGAAESDIVKVLALANKKRSVIPPKAYDRNNNGKPDAIEIYQEDQGGYVLLLYVDKNLTLDDFNQHKPEPMKVK